MDKMATLHNKLVAVIEEERLTFMEVLTVLFILIDEVKEQLKKAAFGGED